MGERHRSVPPSSGPVDKAVASESSTSSKHSIPPPQSSKLLTHANALARMTFELNLRAVSGHAERLERDVRELVRCTEDNKEFRKQNEKRLSDITREIHAVKTQMNQVEKENVGMKVDVEEQQRLTMEFISGFRKEMIDLKNLVDGFTSQLDQLPAIGDIMEETQTQRASPRMETRAAARARRQPETQSLQQSNTKTTSDRIQEAVNSTRRWHIDHKKTPLSDGQFIANYLKQQSKRDPAMALLLQRSLQKRLRSRRGERARPRPRTLEEFCQDIVWQDVIDMAEDVLVKDVERTRKSLK